MSNLNYTSIFIAYARKDQSYLDALITHLVPLQRNKNLAIWYDGLITPGAFWEDDIRRHLDQADFVLVLVSANSLASSYFWNTEVTRALERHRKKETVVIPIILSDCAWEYEQELSQLQVLPKEGKPISRYMGGEALAYTKVVKALGQYIEREQKERGKPTRPLLAGISKSITDFIENGPYDTVDLFNTRLLNINGNRSDQQNKIEISHLPPSIQKLVKDQVSIATGTFDMGSRLGNQDEQPVHSVILSSFSIGKYLVTQEQWKAIMGSNPSHFRNNVNLPVENISWLEIQQFIKKLNNLTSYRFSLPTEAQWEFAARGGIKSQRYRYAGGNNVNTVAYYRGNSQKRTWPVGKKEANELGLYDMSGNVWEWCNDYYKRDYYNFIEYKQNPQGPSQGVHRVVRGGAWNFIEDTCRVSARDKHHPASTKYSYIGFRLVINKQ